MFPLLPVPFNAISKQDPYVQASAAPSPSAMKTSKIGMRYHRRNQEAAVNLPFDSQDALMRGVQDTIALPKFSNVNPKYFDCNPKQAKFFVCKSCCEENLFVALYLDLWSGTSLTNQTLSAAFASGLPVYLFFSVNGSGIYSAVAKMASGVWPSHDLLWPDQVGKHTNVSGSNFFL
jgi:hypothetical protein